MIQPGSDQNKFKHSTKPPGSYREILNLVFFQPRLLLPSITACSWEKALLRVLLTGFVCGVFLALLQVVRLNDDVKGWSSWIAQELDDVWYEEGRLRWRTKADLPYKTYHRGWSVYFAEEGSSFPALEKLGPGSKGVWVSPESVYTWWQSADDSNDRRHAVLYEDEKLFGMISVPPVIPSETRLRGQELEQAIIGVFHQSIPFFCFFRGLGVVFQILFYVLIFSLIPYLLRSPLAADGFGSIFTFYLYASLPAIFIATVYSAFNVPFLDFQTIFAISFVAYLMFVLWTIARTRHEAR